MHIGKTQTPGGRAGEGTTRGISAALQQLGFRVQRFKTGTPPRINGRTIDFSCCEMQPGDEDPQPFSFLTDRLQVEQLPCWICYTNPAVHELIRQNLHLAPMYTGQIQSSGPRYCPSIETKVVRFAEKDQHQVFLEPEGYHTCEFYVNGISTSLPRSVQDQLLGQIPALAHAQILRYGYAVEYDYCPPDQLWPSLETKRVSGTVLRRTNQRDDRLRRSRCPRIAGRCECRPGTPRPRSARSFTRRSVLGVLIDDLVTSGVDEPYRMFTSRAEYRLRLRHDTADRRLTPRAAEVGLVDARRLTMLREKERAITDLTERLHRERIEGVPLSKFLRRPEMDWKDLVIRRPELESVPPPIAWQVQCDIKYAGYVARQEVEIARQKRLSAKRIPEDLNYAQITSLRVEACEKLTRVRPASLDQAGRISGITPADIALLMAYLEGRVPRVPGASGSGVEKG